MALEVFANQPTTTVSSGGTGAPAGGTQETWTVASSSEFPAASSTATPQTQFHVADALSSASSELITVTNVSGTTWTVTRGAEGTTPVAHSAGFTIYQVVSAGGLGAMTQKTAGSSQLPLIYVPPASGDTSGATDTTAIQALENAADTAGSLLVLGAGTYWVTGLTKQSGTIWQGAGRGITFIKLANSSNTDTVQGAGFGSLTLTGQTTLPNAGIGQWGLRDLTIDGNKTHQSGTSYGLRFYGYDFRIEHVTIQNCLTDGLYSEWGNFGGTGLPDFDDTAGYYHDVAIWGNSGNGWHNRGPHDSVAAKVYIFDNGSGSSWGYWGEANNPTTVAAGSNGVNVSTFAGAGTLNVATTLGWNTASISATQGALSVVTSGTAAVITYTGTTATTFTGCTTISGSGTLSTGAAVTPVGAYSAAGQLMAQCHIWFNQAWDYVLDTQTHLIDCIAEVANTGMVLVRGNDCQIEGGFLIIYSQFTATGLGLQIGDTANAVAGLRTDTKITGMSGADSAHASISIVNDTGTNAVDALVYQPSGTAVYGTPSTSSRYRVIAGGAAVAVNAANSLYQDFGLTRVYVPPSSLNAWRLTPGGAATDALNYNSSSGLFQHNNGLIDNWYSGAFTGNTVQIDGGKGHLSFPSGTAPSGAIVTAAIGTSGNGAATAVSGTDARGKITITTASTGIGAFPATAANYTFANAYNATPRMCLTPADGPSAAILPYAQAFSSSQFLLGFNSTPGTATTYTYSYIVEG